jgi:uncharacterized membrane protein YedE/YeeE
MIFETVFIKPWPGWVAGPLIGIYAVAFFYFQRRNLGASSGFPAALEALRGQDRMDLANLDDPLRLPQDPRDQAPRWRVWWMGGLWMAGLLAWALGGAGTGGLDLPGFNETFVGWSLGAKLALLFFGGVLIGFGTRMSGGCTSGHAIFGISQRQLPSLWATLAFFAVGIAVTFGLQAWLKP